MGEWVRLTRVGTGDSAATSATTKAVSGSHADTYSTVSGMSSPGGAGSATGVSEWRMWLVGGGDRTEEW